MVLLAIVLSGSEALGHQLDVSPRRPNAGRRLLLERVQHVHGFRELDRVDRSVRIARVGFNRGEPQNSVNEGVLQFN
jgi:hypothetical protein